jgi:hypothetical protein
VRKPGLSPAQQAESKIKLFHNLKPQHQQAFQATFAPKHPPMLGFTHQESSNHYSLTRGRFRFGIANKCETKCGAFCFAPAFNAMYSCSEITTTASLPGNTIRYGSPRNAASISSPSCAFAVFYLPFWS